MAKKDFAWDTIELIKEIQPTDKLKYEVQKCTGFGKTYVVVTTWYLSSEGWKFKKNLTLPKDIWDQVADAVIGSDIW